MYAVCCMKIHLLTSMGFSEDWGHLIFHRTLPTSTTQQEPLLPALSRLQPRGPQCLSDAVGQQSQQHQAVKEPEHAMKVETTPRTITVTGNPHNQKTK